jgi:hypothetical protein
MKIALKLLTIISISTLVFTACSSKKVEHKVQKVRKVDTKKVQAAYQELDKEIKNNK